MQNYAKEHSIKDVPRLLLLGSYFGKKIGLTTPLLKWYLEHGLVITRIYTIADTKPGNSSYGQMIGNSSYGRMITDKESIMTSFMSMSLELVQKS